MRNRFVATVAVAAVAALGLAACGCRTRPRRPAAGPNTSLATTAGGAGGRWASSPGGPPARRRTASTPRESLQEEVPEQHLRQPGRRWWGRLERQGEAGSDLQNNQPPDSFQGHAGAELLDYIDAEQIEPVNDVIRARWRQGLPEEPARPHHRRGQHLLGAVEHPPANVVWANTEVPRRPASTPSRRTSKLDGRHGQGQGAGVSTPLSVSARGPRCTSSRPCSWPTSASRSTTASSTARRVGLDRGQAGGGRLQDAAVLRQHASDGDDWPVATDMVIDGKAAYNVMGDWAVAQFNSKGKKEQTDYQYFGARDGRGLRLPRRLVHPPPRREEPRRLQGLASRRLGRGPEGVQRPRARSRLAPTCRRPTSRPTSSPRWRRSRATRSSRRSARRAVCSPG